jgi:hypothetical protein
VSHVAQKVFDLGSWNFTGMLISMCSCAPGSFRLDLFSICRVIVLDWVKICNFQLVWHEAQKYLTQGHETLQECWSACEVLNLWIDMFCQSNCPWLTKWKFSILPQNIFNLQSSNLTGMLLSICSCAPWILLVDLSSICRVTTFDLVKTVSSLQECWSACEIMHLGVLSLY